MNTFADVIDALGGSLPLAEALDQPKGTVSAWKTRNSVPAEHWAALVRLAAEKGVSGVSLASLAGMVPARKRPAASREVSTADEAIEAA